MKPIAKIEWLHRAGLWVACIALICMMLVVVVDVISRHALNVPIRGAYDLVSICLLIMIFSGMASVIAERSEILIDIIDGALSASAIRLLKLLASGLTVLASAFLIYSMITPALSAYRYHDRSLELNLPVWTLWVVAFLGLGAMLIVAIARLIEDLQNKSSLDAGRDEAAK